MAVELAVLMPVLIAVALVSVNVMRFAEGCARFDRVAPDAVLTRGVSGSGSQGDLSQVSAVREAIEGAMGEVRCEVEVSVDEQGSESSGATFLLGPGLTRYVCVLKVAPWPSRVGIAGVGYEMPSFLRHERVVVVDRYRAAVVK